MTDSTKAGAAAQGSNGADAAPDLAAMADRAKLAGLLNLTEAELSIKGARIVGNGSTASADLYLSDGTTLTFESLQMFTSPSRLALQVASCTGVRCPILKVPKALEAVVLLRSIAERIDATTADDVAIEWGSSYLQSADVRTVNIGEQAERWAAFVALERKRDVVLEGLDGMRYVRSGWFFEFARQCDHAAGSNGAVATRMERVGWTRRGKHGRIKATHPTFPRALVWSFFEVPAGWEAAQGGYE